MLKELIFMNFVKGKIIFGVLLVILTGVSSGRAQDSSPTPVVGGATPAATPGSTAKHHKKKVSAQATAQPTTQPTLSITLSPTPVKTLTVKPTATPTPTPTTAPEMTSMGAISSSKIYDRINMPGDFRRTLAYAVKTLNTASRKQGRTICFLSTWRRSPPTRTTRKEGTPTRRFEITEMEIRGTPRPLDPTGRNRFLDQKGDDCESGRPHRAGS